MKKRPITNKQWNQAPIILLVVALLFTAVLSVRAGMADSVQAVRRVNIPNVEGNPDFEPAIFWFGQVTPTINNADVRLWYHDTGIEVVVHIIDRRLWYDESPTKATLDDWDAVSLFLNVNGTTGGSPTTGTYRMVSGMWGGSERQAAYKGTGSAWTGIPVPFTSDMAWRSENGPNNNSDDKGWQLSYFIPFSGLGLSGPPAEGTKWGFAVAVHDRDEADGNPAIDDQVWPETAEATVPSTWGEMNFGVPVYNPPEIEQKGTTTIRHGLNGADVVDGQVGGHTTCGEGLDHWTEWGEKNYAGFNQINIQNQWDISDYPCFSKYYVTFPLDTLPADKTILGASLSMTMFGNAGGGEWGVPQDSHIVALTVAEDWGEGSLDWNNAPMAQENISSTWVKPVQTSDQRIYDWDVSRAVAEAYEEGKPLRLALYSTDGELHSGKYFWTSDVNNYDAAMRPTLNVNWGDSCDGQCSTSTPVPPTNTPPPPTNTPIPPTNTPMHSGGNVYFVSSSSGGKAGGVKFADEDILKFDASSGAWSMFFDGSDVGLNSSGYQDINAFHILDDGSILFSVIGDTTVPDVGAVDDSDIIRFVPTSTGSLTKGSFEPYFDGSDVDLTASSEDIDALTVTADGDLIVSTLGSGEVNGLRFKDEDLLRFTADPNSTGTNTSGSWELYFDGSDVGLANSSSEDVWGAWVDGARGTVYLTSLKVFAVSGVSGDGTDIFRCQPAALGVLTSCLFQMEWDGSANGFGSELVDGISLEVVEGGTPPTNTPVPPTNTSVPPTNTSVPPTNTPVPPTNTPDPGSGSGILDSFNRTNGTLGSNWSGSTGDYRVASNRLDVGFSQDIYWGASAFGADQEVYVTLTNIDTNALEMGLLLKSQSKSGYDSGVIEVYYVPGRNVVEVWTNGSQGWSMHGTSVPVTFANGDQFGARATASGQVEIYRNGNLLAVRDVSAWNDHAKGGYIGLYNVDASNAIQDDFGGGTTGSAPPPPTNTPGGPTNTPAPPTSTPVGPTSTPGPTGAEWPMLAANLERTSWTPEEVRGDLNVQWYRPIEPYIPYKIQPIAANGKIYVSTSKGLYAFNASNGSQSWVYATELPLGHSPTIADINGKSIAFVGGHDRKIHAIDANSGAKISGYTPYEADAGFETNPVVVNNTIYAGNRDGYFYAFNAVTGSLKWKYKTDAAIHYSAAFKNGVVYFASNDAHAYALNANNGSLIWKSQKLPGSGFQTYWPVIYTNKASGKDYVIFTSGENLRFGVMNLIVEESDTIYSGVPGNQVIGSTSSSIPGDWTPGTVSIDASILTEYFEDRPDRRTVFVLDSANGNEFTFDSDGDGRREYAPFNWGGVTHSGTKHPPIVNGVDGVYYQATGYIAPGWISRSGTVGWKFGTEYISRVDGKDNGFASDEPLAFSSGGKLVYWSLCCDREAGAMDVTMPYGQSNRSWFLHQYNLASNALAPGYQQMYNSGDSHDYGNVNGWQHYSGKNQSKNGVYGKHGSNQSAPVPYQGKVYMLQGNSLIAFSSTGSNPKTPLPLATIAGSQSQPAPLSRTELGQRLDSEIQKMLAAGPLRPGYRDSGFVDVYGNAGFTDERTMGEIFDYFQNPSDTVYTLLLAYPHLSTSTQQQVKTFLVNNYGPGRKYDITRIAHVGWSGATREHLVIPQEVSDQWGQLYASPWEPSTEPTCGWCGYWEFPPFNFYAAWQYAQIVGNNDQAFAKNVFDRMSGKLDSPLSDYTFGRKPYWLNQYIAGYKGYLELQKLAGYSQSQSVLNDYQDMLALRANNFDKDTPFLPLGNESAAGDFELAYQNTLAVARNFMFLTPELGEYLNQQIYSQVDTAVEEYEYVAPYWFVSNFDSSYGEGTFQHLYDTPALFQAKAYILKQPYNELVKWLDAPAFYRGDLFYIQNIVAALDAG